MSNVKTAMSQAAAAGVPPDGAWDLAYAYLDDPFVWDITSASQTASFYVGSQELAPHGIFFKPDGTKMYVTGESGDDVNEYTLSTAWDVSSASYVQNFSVSAQETEPMGLSFKPDGTKMYVLGKQGKDVNEYNLSTAWDVSSASYSQNFSVSTQDTGPEGVFFKPDGTKMYIVGSTGIDVNEYDLSTAWDVSSASYSQNFSVSAQQTTPRGVFFKPDGTKMYIVGISSAFIHEYNLSTAWDVSSASYSQNVTVPSGSNDLFFKPDGSKLYVMVGTGDTVYQYSLGGFSVASQEVSPTGLFFKPDGLRLYVTGQSGDDVNEYHLSAEWDTSTATYVRTFDTGTVTTSPQGLFFKPDGTTLYTIGSSSDAVSQWSLSVPWDISSTSYVQQFSVAAQDTFPTGISFKPDGTKMFVMGLTGDDVNEYNLSTPWDVSTAVFSQLFSVISEDGQSYDLFFKPDGTKMYTTGTSGDEVNEYSLSTAWDVSTASYLKNFLLGTSTTSGFKIGVFFRPDGTQMFAISAVRDRVFTYSLGVQA